MKTWLKSFYGTCPLRLVGKSSLVYIQTIWNPAPEAPLPSKYTTRIQVLWALGMNASTEKEVLDTS